MEAAAGITEEKLLRRYAVRDRHHKRESEPSTEEMRAIFRRGGKRANRERERLLKRMHCPSKFAKEVKQRFTRRSNETHNHTGAIWAGRADISLVETSPQALLAVATYIDLNPLRAGITTDPADYPYCTYSRALNGDQDALSSIWTLIDLCGIQWDDPLARYQQFLASASTRRIEGKTSLSPQPASVVFYKRRR